MIVAAISLRIEGLLFKRGVSADQAAEKLRVKRQTFVADLSVISFAAVRSLVPI